MDRFVGRVALVTGVSSGIGEQIAEQLVQAGLVVVGVARRSERLAELSTKLAEERGTFHPQTADVSREEDIRRVYQWVEDNLGGVSIVVNNAAMLTLVPVQDLDATTIQQLINTNVTSVMLSCREALNSMKKHGIKDGHIVNINSVSGHTVHNASAPLSTAAYSATKHAITALCKGLRFDVQQMEGFKIRVSSISPGGVLTDMLVSKFGDSLDPTMLLKASDVANAVVYVLSSPPGVEISELTLRTTGEKV